MINDVFMICQEMGGIAALGFREIKSMFYLSVKKKKENKEDIWLLQV